MVTKVTIHFNMDFYTEGFKPVARITTISSRFPINIIYELYWIHLKNQDTWLVFHRSEVQRLEAECLA